ncbi:MAG: hypothetical protein CL878_02860 [Dehalococcoidia bacterium]|nr:hypothetical protein [Dehalococcoidia bacterium]
MNVLLIYTDQQQRRTMSAYGNDVALTPNLNQFSQHGVVFESAVCPQPVCVPSRCATFTGVNVHTHGVFANGHPLPRHIPTVAEMVVDHGVRTGYIGKWHMGREVLPQRGFEEFFHAVDDNYTPAKDLPLYGLSGYGRWLVEKGYAPDQGQGAGGWFSRDFAARLPEEHTKPAFISEQACRFLEGRQDEPFLLVCSFLEPHNPYHSPYDDLHDPDETELPDNFHTEPLPDWPQRNAVFQEWARTVAHEDGLRYDTEEKWRGLIARYYGLAHHMDHHVGVILDKLDALGLRDDTLVIFTSDHGDMMGSHGMYMKSMMYEESAGVPLLMRGPAIEGGRRIAEPTSQLDLTPTILDACGVAPRAELPGKSLLPLLRGERDEDSEAVAVCEWNGTVQRMFSRLPLFAGVKGEWIRSIRTRRWKLNVYRDDVSELYDLEQDPGEMLNLIHEPARRPVVEDLFERLREWQRETNDIVDLPHPLESAEPG